VARAGTPPLGHWVPPRAAAPALGPAATSACGSPSRRLSCAPGSLHARYAGHGAQEASAGADAEVNPLVPPWPLSTLRELRGMPLTGAPGAWGTPHSSPRAAVGTGLPYYVTKPPCETWKTFLKFPVPITVQPISLHVLLQMS